MPNENDNIPKKSFKKVDALVTGMLLGGIVASIYGIKKTVDMQAAKKEGERVTEEKKSGLKRILNLLFFGVKKEEKEKRRSIFSIFKK